MSRYGESDLVNDPRYQGQSGGTDAMRGPEGESRYGAAPMSTGTGNDPRDPQENIRNPAAYGFKRDEPEGFRYPGVRSQQHQGLAVPDAHPSQAGYGASQLGYGQHEGPRDDFAKEQPGYGQPGFGAPSQGQNTGSLWPTPTAPANAHRSDVVGQEYGAPREGMVDRAKDAVGMGPNSGYDNRRDEPGYGVQGYGGQPREGMMDRAKDAVGMGPNSGYDNRRDEPGYGTAGYGDQPREGMVDRAKNAVGMGPNSGYNNRRDEPGYGAAGYGGQPREGMVDRAKDIVGMGPNSGYDNRRDEPGYGAAGYGGQPREGMMDRAKDTVGMGPSSGQPYDYNPNVNHPSETRGFGGGVGTEPGYDQSQNLGSGYDNRMTTGADAYTQPRREGVVDRMKDDVGVGPKSGYAEDRVTGVNEPSMLGENLPQGERVPESMIGERRTEPGYDMSTGHFSEKRDDRHTGTELGQRDNEYDEGRGKGFDNRRADEGEYDTTNTGTETGYDDTGVQHGTDTAPPKKGLITKIKEKMQHSQ